jgi:hypothetical protein
MGEGDKRRIHDENDLVRFEIQTAIEREIPVIPVLVDSATMPQSADLPDVLKRLAFHNPAEVAPGRDFHVHMRRLINAIERTLPEIAKAAEKIPLPLHQNKLAPRRGGDTSTAVGSTPGAPFTHLHLKGPLSRRGRFAVLASALVTGTGALVLALFWFGLIDGSTFSFRTMKEASVSETRNVEGPATIQRQSTISVPLSDVPQTSVAAQSTAVIEPDRSTASDPAGPPPATMSSEPPAKKLDQQKVEIERTQKQSTPATASDPTGLGSKAPASSGPMAPQHETRISDRPKYDCINPETSLVRILCADRETARAWWDLNSAYYAGYFSVDRELRGSFANDEEKWRKALAYNCALPSEATQAFFPQQRACVIKEYRNRAAKYYGRLKGDALAEADIQPERRAQIQEALRQLGYLHSSADGLFGEETRQAIKQYQRDNNFKETGFLTKSQLNSFLLHTSPTDQSIPSDAGSLWNLNGSTLYLVTGPNKRRKFFYLTPNPDLADETGVKGGTLFFDGRRVEMEYVGIAYRY